MKTWLVFDCNYLCWRAHYSTGSLTWHRQPTGVIYGFLRDLNVLRELHATERLAFCFDHSRKHLLRRADYPGYKQSRFVKGSPIEEAMYKDVHKQIIQLRKDILPALGFRNIFSEKGYEADDLIASIVNSLGAKEEAIIVSGDQDLYQLLGPKVLIYNPTKGKAITENSFSREYGVTPIQWVDVKAIAGCTGDDVVGIRGVGEKTACQFLNGKLQASSVKHQLIVHGNKLWKRNRGLVKLPYPGTPEYRLKKDKATRSKWQAICKRFGLRSLD